MLKSITEVHKWTEYNQTSLQVNLSKIANVDANEQI